MRKDSKYPCLHVPTLADKAKFLTALYAAGWSWGGYGHEGWKLQLTKYNQSDYPYMIFLEGRFFMQEDYDPENELLMNSSFQILQYCEKIWVGKKPPLLGK